MKILKKIILVILLLASVAALGFMIYVRYTAEPCEPDPEPSPSVTPSPSPSPSEAPREESFVITIVGDNTLSSSESGGTFVSTVGDDYAYPYANTIQYFKDDSLSIANLECNFSDKTLYSDSMFCFKAPTKYTEILKQGSIEFVTTANNHTSDFGQTGLEDTYAALDKAGIAYGKDGSHAIVEAEGGLKVGIYCGSSYINTQRIRDEIAAMREEGAELVICALHWGNEGEYRPTEGQQIIAHTCIDAGADIVYGSHPHVLQPVEEYGGGLIMYSMGNWSFGGNRSPRDMDTAIVQLTVKRGDDGKAFIDKYELIPCCISSASGYNNYQPTPYDKNSEGYSRTMSKLDGSFTGANLIPSYAGGGTSGGGTAAPSATPSAEASGETSSGTDSSSGAGTEAVPDVPVVEDAAG